MVSNGIVLPTVDVLIESWLMYFAVLVICFLRTRNIYSRTDVKTNVTYHHLEIRMVYHQMLGIDRDCGKFSPHELTTYLGCSQKITMTDFTNDRNRDQ